MARDLGGLLRGQVPAAESGGLFGFIEGLLLAALALTALSGAAWFVTQGSSDALAWREFHIYAARHVDEALEILTGVPAGYPDANAEYPQGTVNGQVQRRLSEWTALRQRYLAPPGNHDNGP